jgi:hypothetical protein
VTRAATCARCGHSTPTCKRCGEEWPFLGSWSTTKAGEVVELCHTFADPPAGEWTCYEVVQFRRAAEGLE